MSKEGGSGSSGSGSRQKEGVDALVKEYLLSRGYVKAAEQLALEAQSGTGTMEDMQESVTEQLLSSVELVVLGLRDGDAASYIAGYDAVRCWALDAIDMARPELLALTFPLFVHCYIGMVRLGFEAEAMHFFRLRRSEHSAYAQEMQGLSTITSKGQLKARSYGRVDGGGGGGGVGGEGVGSGEEFDVGYHPFVRCALAHRFTVRLSSLAYNLLALFLVQADLLLITSIINDKIRFRKLDPVVGLGGDSELEEGVLVELPEYTAGAEGGG
ncbi:hypothetical protein B484DRAFT_438254, partial [Ochromonadaceae sp. CCMP2298]